MNELKEIKRLIKKIYKAKEKIEYYYFVMFQLDYHSTGVEKLHEKLIKKINDKINEEKALIEVTKRKVERLVKEL